MKVINVVRELPVHPTKKYLKREWKEVNQIIIHHTASESIGLVGYAEYHIKEKGWPGIAYHFMILPDGLVYQVNNEETISYHCAGQNHNSIGICLVGNISNHPETKEQSESIIKLINMIKRCFTIECIAKHSDFHNTECCGLKFSIDLNCL